MKLIENKIEHLCEELDGAMHYAEKYLENKARGNPRYTKFKEMAMDELHHAEILFSFDLEDLQEISRVYKMTEVDEEKWEHMKKKFAEKVAMVKHLLQ